MANAFFYPAGDTPLHIWLLSCVDWTANVTEVRSVAAQIGRESIDGIQEPLSHVLAVTLTPSAHQTTRARGSRKRARQFRRRRPLAEYVRGVGSQRIPLGFNVDQWYDLYNSQSAIF